MKKKKFIISIDTEGDNLWRWKLGDKITTENVQYLPRFQNLANKYGFKPVWLSNYEMLSDERFIKFAKRVEIDSLGEIGMHLHAWNTPPEYALLAEAEGAPYLIEYPMSAMERKIATMTTMIKEKLCIQPTTHRAGRWAMNDSYIDLLHKYGYKVDCSVTPHINWNSKKGLTRESAGSNYLNCPETPYYWHDIIEIPMSIRKSNKMFLDDKSFRGLAVSAYHAVKGQYLWLRPNGLNLNQMKWLVDYVENSDSDYIMFMLHSSEMMPGGSPTFQTEESIEKMYYDTEAIFKIASKNFEGVTLREYADEAVK